MTNSKTDYGYYSKKLGRPFDTLDQLRSAEAAAQKEQEEKILAAKAKKDAAAAVENAYKELNEAKKSYKKDMNNALIKYTEAMKIIQGEFDVEKQMIVNKLSEAEANYKAKLKEFTVKHPEGFHITLKDGDYETTISSEAKSTNNNDSDWVAKLFGELFGAL